MMDRRCGWVAMLRAVALACAVAGAAPIAKAAPAERRLALVIGEAGYRSGTLPTSANDAGLIAQALAQAGFAVTGYTDLPGEDVRRAFADFVAEAKRAGPDAVVFLYLSGYGVQFDGSNFIVPVDAQLTRDTEVPVQAVSLATLTQSLDALPLKARIVVADLARPITAAQAGSSLASGLALVEPQTGSLVVYNTAPGAVVRPEQGLYGSFADALFDGMQLRGVPVESMIARVRLRVADVTNGGAIPWTGGTLDRSFALFPAESSLSAHSNTTESPTETLSAHDAFWQAISRDTLQSYVAFAKAYPRDPLVHRIVALIATRREALTWIQAGRVNTPAAYWTYMRRYPRGPHFPDARRRLAAIAAALEPPPRFEPYAFVDVPPPRPDERDILDRPFVMFDDEGDGPVPALESLPTTPPKALPQSRLPPLLPVDAGMLPLPFPPPLGFAHSTGPIIQPGFAGRSGTVIALDSKDRDGNPSVIQSRTDQTIVSVATLVPGPNGKRTVTQTGLNQRTVYAILETTGPHGASTVTQMGANARVLAITKTVTDGSGNAVVTVSGPDDRPISVTITGTDGRIARPNEARVAPQPAPSRLTVFEAAGMPKAATIAAGSKPARVEADGTAGSAPRPSAPPITTVPGPGAPALLDPSPPKAMVAPIVPDAKAVAVPTIKEPVVPFVEPAEPKSVATPDPRDAAPPRNVVMPAEPKPPAAPMVTPQGAPAADKAVSRPAAEPMLPSPDPRPPAPPQAVTPKSEPVMEPLPPRRPAKALAPAPKAKAGARPRKESPAPTASPAVKKGDRKP